MRHTLFAVLILLSTLSAGCVTFFDYYEPHVPGGKAISSCRAYSPAPKNTLKYEIGSVMFHAELMRSIRTLAVTFYVPKGNSVLLTDNELLVRQGKNANTKIAKITRLSYFEDKKHIELENPLTIILEGDTTEDLLLKIHKKFFVSAKLDFYLEDELFVTFPPISLNGELFQVPEIRFTRGQRWALCGLKA